MNDYCFEKFTEGSINYEQQVEMNGETMDLWDVCSDSLSGNGHKQQDPRELEGKDSGFEFLLLQIDTDDEENDIMWGDCGVANLFIKEKDLKKLDFSKVMYNGDCY